MKIQKILFSASDEYVDFWEPVSQIFYEKLGIESVLIYFGQNIIPTEKYGKVYRVSYLNYPKRIQHLWSRVWYAKMEPETTWLLGDIDLFPLQRDRYINLIKDIPDNFHIHLAHNKISDPPCFWQIKGPRDKGADLTSHYHVGKGWVFDKNFELHDSFENACKFIFECKQYGLGFFCEAFNNDEWRYHCCCEHLTTELLRKKLNSINFYGIYYDYWRGISRGQTHAYNPDLLKQNWYIDYHSLRPYTINKEEINKILELAWKNK